MVRWYSFLLVMTWSLSQATGQSLQGDRLEGRSWATRSPVVSQRGMAATSHPLASQVAIDILKKGGSAVDAAIAAHAALGLMEPMMSGIGGDAFVILWDPKTGRLHGYNGSGRSPAGLSLQQLREIAGPTGIPLRGALSVTVPGAVDAWFALHSRFGKLPMSDLLAPSVDYAEEGFPVTQQIARYWRDTQLPETDGRTRADGHFDNFRALYFPSGEAPAEGEVFRNPNLARAYARIARQGRDAFYRGPIADAIDGYLKRIGGFVRRSDLEGHTGNWIDPVSTRYRGVDVYELPPNGQGVVALQILNILEGYDVAAMDRFGPEFSHLFIEAKKLAFEDRARMYADPDFYDMPIEELLSKQRAARQRRRIDPHKAAPMAKWDAAPIEQGDTTYLTVADGSGMMVSFIASVAAGFGSFLVPDGQGFVLQNRGAHYTFRPGHPNIFAPSKRPFHTIIPAFAMKDGRPWLSFGLMGGSMQPQGHAQIIINLVDFGMNPQEAGDAVRIRHVGGLQPRRSANPSGSQTALETGFPGATVNGLIERGHLVRSGTWIGFGGYQAILWDDEHKTFTGATEMRKDGEVVGY